MTDAAPAVELSGITKRFPGVVANADVNLRVLPGEVHAIVGENGAGKSTLMKILYGMLAPDEGTISVRGEVVRFRSPKDAIAREIGMVHQHFMLADNLTVLENVILGSEPTRAGLIDFVTARERITELSRRYGMHVDAAAYVADLSVGEEQRVEILKALYRGARILILDEPTAVLVPSEVNELFANLAELRAEGVTIIFIDHKLDEVLRIADSITVLRRGRTVATVKPADVDAHRLAELMVGSELPTPETRERTVTDTVELSVRELGARLAGGRWLIEGATFEIRRGEVLGIAGVEGNGQKELVELIMGLRPADTGTVTLHGADVTRMSTRDRRDAGIGYIPEDRHERGLLLPSPLWENTMLGHQASQPFSNGFWIQPDKAVERTNEVTARYDVRTPGPSVPAFALSGGNQQKLIVGREFAAGPTVLLASQPTRGIDVGAQAAVWERIREARASGMAVLLVSADLDELIGLSDRLMVILRGRLVAELDPNAVTPEELGSYMTGARQATTAKPLPQTPTSTAAAATQHTDPTVPATGPGGEP